MTVSPSYVHFDEMTWPRAGDAAGELQWRLRYAQRQLTETDLFHAASIISAYRALILEKTQKERNRIAKVLTDAESLPTPSETQKEKGGTQ